MVIAIAILAVLGAAIVPTATSYLDQNEIADTATQLTNLNTSINNFRKSTNVNKYPLRLSHLTTAILSTDTSSCSGLAPSPSTVSTYGPGNAGAWLTEGPYYTPRLIGRNGFQLGIGTANDIMSRTSNNTTAGFLNITIPSIAFADAADLNTFMDGPGDLNQANRSNTTGAIQWGAPSAADIVTVTYGVGVAKTC